MNRFGVEPERAVDLVEKAKDYQNILVEAIYSHFYPLRDRVHPGRTRRSPRGRFVLNDVDDSRYRKASLEQWQKFSEVLFDLQRRDLEIPLRHLANSEAIIDFDRSFFEIVRPGALLYGLMGREELKVKPVLSWKTRILRLRRIKRGGCVGYGCSFRAKKDIDLAVIGIGYADGYDRRLSNQAEVLIKGRRCKVVGAVCMDHAFVDLSPAMRVSKKLSPQVGDEVVLIGVQGREEIRAQELADWVKTDVREIVSRIPREAIREYKSR
jgi:alanine racemase